MSSPDFVARRPIQAHLVLPKAQLYADAKLRELLFFIQFLTQHPEGLRLLSEKLVFRYPTRCRMPEIDEIINFSLHQFFEARRDAVLLRRLVKLYLPDFLTELLLNPERNAAKISCPYFSDLGDALYEFKREYETAALKDFVVTSAGRAIFNTLDQALRASRMVVIEGNPGMGKSANARAWCAARPAGPVAKAFAVVRLLLKW